MRCSVAFCRNVLANFDAFDSALDVENQIVRNVSAHFIIFYVKCVSVLFAIYYMNKITTKSCVCATPPFKQKQNACYNRGLSKLTAICISEIIHERK